MRRMPILVKLTAAFAVATMLMLAAAAAFVYFRLRADQDDRVDANLQARAVAAATAYADGTALAGVALEDPEESFAQVLTPSGVVVASAGTLRGPALTPDEVDRASRAEVVVERALRGVDGVARILAVPHGSGEGAVVIAIGQSLRDRNEALSSVVTSFLVGGVVALMAASGAGYLLARSGLAPVEAMRVRASQISARDDDTRLPLPEADDQIRRLGETLNDMLGRLHASYLRERRFVDDASHELRTPLAIILTDIEGALLAHDLPDDVRAALVSARDETHRLVRIADDLLALARATDGRLPLLCRPTSVRSLLTWAQTRFEGLARRTGRTITVTAPEAEILGDQDRLRQLITNLVDNALRHGAGDITLVATLDQEGTTQIEVRDEGPGFSADFAPRAFERLSRDDPARQGRGAGIGLAIVSAIVEAHGGTATVGIGRPAAVRVRLPARPQDAPRD